MRERFSSLIGTLDRLIKEAEEPKQHWKDKAFSNDKHRKQGAGLCHLKDRLDQYLSAEPVLGFNSQRYDLNVLKPALMRSLHEREEGQFVFVVKKTNSLTCVETKPLRFLDICNYIAPGFPMTST